MKPQLRSVMLGVSLAGCLVLFLVVGLVVDRHAERLTALEHNGAQQTLALIGHSDAIDTINETLTNINATLGHLIRHAGAATEIVPVGADTREWRRQPSSEPVWALVEHIETRPADDGCNTCTKQGPGSWICTLMACLNPKEVEDWERKKAAHETPIIRLPHGSSNQQDLTYDGRFSSDSQCLAQMEAAMRAVDQFLAKAFLDGTDRIKSPGYTEKGKAELERAYQQWGTTTRTCWRQP